MLTAVHIAILGLLLAALFGALDQMASALHEANIGHLIWTGIASVIAGLPSCL